MGRDGQSNFNPEMTGENKDELDINIADTSKKTKDEEETKVKESEPEDETEKGEKLRITLINHKRIETTGDISISGSKFKVGQDLKYTGPDSDYDEIYKNVTSMKVIGFIEYPIGLKPAIQINGGEYGGKCSFILDINDGNFEIIKEREEEPKSDV